MREYDIAIMGAGAAGLMAAATAAKAAPRGSVVLLEGNGKPGKKLLATGNGRCNLSNERMDMSHYYGDTAAVPGLLARYGCARVCGEFAAMGLKTVTDPEGRVYPMSFQAASVLKILSETCLERGVDLLQDFTAFSALRVQGGFLVKAADGRELKAKKLILATGGMASPRHSCAPGGEGLPDGYRIARQLGHRVTPLSPALTRLKVKHKFIKPLSGVRCKAEAALFQEGEPLRREAGEIIFGEGSVSGICVFGLSLAMPRDGKGLSLVLDLCPGLSREALSAFLRTLAANRPALAAGGVLDGVTHMKAGLQVVRECGVDSLAPLSSLKPGDLARVAKTAKAVVLPVLGLGGWEEAQVTAGGVAMEQVDGLTMASRLCPGLYFAGELLNVHGDCGGYNLHWAFATGLAAGEAAAATRIEL